MAEPGPSPVLDQQPLARPSEPWPDAPGPDADPHQLSDYMEQVGQRYDGLVREFAVRVEPDDRRSYQEMVQAAADQHHADPDGWVAAQAEAVISAEERRHGPYPPDQRADEIARELEYHTALASKILGADETTRADFASQAAEREEAERRFKGVPDPGPDVPPADPSDVVGTGAGAAKRLFDRATGAAKRGAATAAKVAGNVASAPLSAVAELASRYHNLDPRTKRRVALVGALAVASFLVLSKSGAAVHGIEELGADAAVPAGVDQVPFDPSDHQPTDWGNSTHPSAGNYQPSTWGDQAQPGADQVPNDAPNHNPSTWDGKAQGVDNNYTDPAAGRGPGPDGGPAVAAGADQMPSDPSVRHDPSTWGGKDHTVSGSYQEPGMGRGPGPDGGPAVEAHNGAPEYTVTSKAGVDGEPDSLYGYADKVLAQHGIDNPTQHQRDTVAQALIDSNEHYGDQQMIKDGQEIKLDAGHDAAAQFTGRTEDMPANVPTAPDKADNSSAYTAPSSSGGTPANPASEGPHGTLPDGYPPQMQDMDPALLEPFKIHPGDSGGEWFERMGIDPAEWDRIAPDLNGKYPEVYQENGDYRLNMPGNDQGYPSFAFMREVADRVNLDLGDLLNPDNGNGPKKV